MVDNDAEFRRSIKQRSPSIYLRSEHTVNCRMLPDRDVLLEALPRNGVVAEVGVAFGDYTRQILAINQPRKLHLVDLWGSERYQQGLEKIKLENSDAIDGGLIEIHQGMSTDQLEKFPDNYFDWVYIDTDHSYQTTYKELVTSENSIKPDGFIAGHDFCTGNVITPWPYGVIEACNQFCVEHNWQYRFLTIEPHGHLSFALSRL